MAQTQMQKTKAACNKSFDAGLSILLSNLESWEACGDWEPTAYLVAHHRDKGIVKRILGYVLADGIEVKTGVDAKGSKHGAVIEGAKGRLNDLFDRDKLEVLAKLVAKNTKRNTRVIVEGKSVSAIDHAFPPEPKPEKEFVVTDWADRVVKAHPDQLEAMIAALQAKRK